MPRHEAIRIVLNQLRKHLGTGEHPPGSNHNFITVWYNEHVAKIGDGPWCQMTDTWSVWTAGFEELLAGTAWTVQAAINAQHKLKGSSWYAGTKGMMKGDQVYYDWSGSKSVSAIDHTGTVEKINGDGTFYVLEGNCSDQLRRVKRDGKFVVGYVRHDWDRVSEQGHKPPAKPTHPVEHHPEHKPEPTPPEHQPAHHPEPTHDKSTPKEIIEVLQRIFGVKVDGIWGRQTDKAVLAFRREHRQNN